MGDDGCFTIKLYYNGIMRHNPKQYIGGDVEYFDFVDIDKLGMPDFWGFAEEVGYSVRGSVRYWHKYGKTMDKGRYLEHDNTVLAINKHIPSNYEVEIYLEHLDGRGIVESQAECSGVVNDSESGLGENVQPVEEPVEETVEVAVFSETDEEDSDFYDSEYDFEEDDKLFEVYVDPDIELMGSKDKGKSVLEENEYVTEKMYDRMQNEEGDEDCVDDSDSLDSACGSDDESPGKKYPKFNPRAHSKNPDLELGLVFDSKQQAKFAIQSHCLRRGMMVQFEKNDGSRLRAKCKNKGCVWTVHVSLMQGDHTWQIKTYNPEHSNCYWNYNNKSLRSNWIGKTFVKKFKSNPKLGTSAFRDEICTTLKANVSRSQAYRAKRKALKIMQGNIEDQFSRIRDYCNELKRTDDKATVILKLTEDEEGIRFHRLYICFSACKDGFKAACRPVVGVDGCFLKGQKGGQLLSAVGIDPNNNIFPICFALVEGETKDTWMWFLNLLDGDLGISENQYRWTFMSDKQKGLIPAFESLFPDAENRFCVRHLHTNMKKDGFGGMAVKNALWAAARASRIEEFGRRLEELKAIDELAYSWLVKKPPNQWSRSHFSPFPKCDILLNNMCECFNSFILDAREKPIIPMLETIRTLLMTRLQLNREKAEKWDSAICPKIRTLLIKNMKDAGECIPIRSDEWNFQIVGPFDQYTVNVKEMSCSCRRWELTGIPCRHAISAIWCRNENPEMYVHKYYNVEEYKKCYEKPIMPINGPDLWPKCQLVPPLPPKYDEKADVGRPQKQRRRQPDEPPAPGIQTKLRGVIRKKNKCRLCGTVGHNSKGCKRKRNTVNEQTQTQRSNAGAGHGPTPHSPVNPQTAAVQVATSSASSSGVNQKTTQTKEKLQVRRPSKKGVNIGGTSNRIASVNINQGPTIHTPMLIKGGKNYITLTNLRASSGNQSNSGPNSGNPSLKPPTHPNMVLQPSNVAASQSASKSVSMSGKSASQPAPKYTSQAPPKSASQPSGSSVSKKFWRP
ncbi:hypothetical protein BUALT_Bualt11G0107800 [Buddleja alternifolia]|uniref:SWIM-type domain-containing protein n=1 Tax=Buddleja alternifolia TaxID=168488 RepID=A0AAV6WVT6_9LAMI|nr:hypothetical protein BUALT_Bualt11G0107800 [Buddleja alternifolia]